MIHKEGNKIKNHTQPDNLPSEEIWPEYEYCPRCYAKGMIPQIADKSMTDIPA